MKLRLQKAFNFLIWLQVLNKEAIKSAAQALMYFLTKNQKTKNKNPKTKNQNSPKNPNTNNKKPPKTKKKTTKSILKKRESASKTLKNQDLHTEMNWSSKFIFWDLNIYCPPADIVLIIVSRNKLQRNLKYIEKNAVPQIKALIVIYGKIVLQSPL